MSDPRLSKLQESYIKKMEREKQVRELTLSRMKNRNRMFFVGGLAAVFGIYFYTISTFKQETFLDQLDLEVAKEREKQKDKSSP